MERYLFVLFTAVFENCILYDRSAKKRRHSDKKYSSENDSSDSDESPSSSSDSSKSNFT